jgi:hypothetical protein
MAEQQAVAGSAPQAGSGSTTGAAGAAAAGTGAPAAASGGAKSAPKGAPKATPNAAAKLPVSQGPPIGGALVDPLPPLEGDIAAEIAAIKKAKAGGAGDDDGDADAEPKPKKKTDDDAETAEEADDDTDDESDDADGDDEPKPKKKKDADDDDAETAEEADGDTDDESDDYGDADDGDDEAPDEGDEKPIAATKDDPKGVKERIDALNERVRRRDEEHAAIVAEYDEKIATLAEQARFRDEFTALAKADPSLTALRILMSEDRKLKLSDFEKCDDPEGTFEAVHEALFQLREERGATEKKTPAATSKEYARGLKKQEAAFAKDPVLRRLSGAEVLKAYDFIIAQKKAGNKHAWTLRDAVYAAIPDRIREIHQDRGRRRAVRERQQRERIINLPPKGAGGAPKKALTTAERAAMPFVDDLKKELEELRTGT